MLTVVTGGAGFLGRALAARMAAHGCAGRVVLFDRELAPLPGAGFEAVTFDICDHAALRDAVRSADRVVHFAALPGAAARHVRGRCARLPPRRQPGGVRRSRVRGTCAGETD